MSGAASAQATHRHAIATGAPTLGVGAVLAVLNERKDSMPSCPQCHGPRVQRWGHSGGVQRFRCKTCTRSFNALTGTPLARLRRRDLWLDYAQALNEGLSIRAAGRRLGIHHNTTFRWRHRWLIHPADCRDTEFHGIIEVESVTFVDVRNGEQPWRRVAMPPPDAEPPDDRHQCLPELRPTDCPHMPRGPQLPAILVLVARDRRGATTDGVLDAFDQTSVETVLTPILGSGRTSLCTPGSAIFADIASDWRIAHHPAPGNAAARPSVIFHRANVQGYVRRLERWMLRFLGVSARYLGHYLGWRRLLDRHSPPPPALAWLRLALGRDQPPTVATRQVLAARKSARRAPPSPPMQPRPNHVTFF